MPDIEFYSKRVRKGMSRRKAGVASSTEDTALNWCDIAGAISAVVSAAVSVATLGVVVYGYVYTVLPVFQHQLLQEKAAQLELANEASKMELKDLEALRKEIEKDLEGQRFALEEAKWDRLCTDLGNWHNFWDRGSQPAATLGFQEFISAARRVFPDPFRELAEVLDRLERGEETKDYPEGSIDVVRRLLQERRGSLGCGEVEWDRIIDQHNAELRRAVDRAGALADARVAQMTDGQDRGAIGQDELDKLKKNIYESVMAEQRARVEAATRSRITTRLFTCRMRPLGFLSSLEQCQGQHRTTQDRSDSKELQDNPSIGEEP